MGQSFRYDGTILLSTDVARSLSVMEWRSAGRRLRRNLKCWTSCELPVLQHCGRLSTKNAVKILGPNLLVKFLLRSDSVTQAEQI